MSADHNLGFDQEEVWKVKLGDNYQASAQYCKDGKACDAAISGTWSTIYDQAMRVELDNGTRFITNFRYNIKPSLSQNPLADGASAFAGTKTGDYASFDSDCTKTMVGFV